MRIQMSFNGEEEHLPLGMTAGNDSMGIDFGATQTVAGIPPGGATGQYLRKNSAADYDAGWADGNVFWAVYETTPFADIVAAHSAGKAVFVKDDGGMIYALDYVAKHHVTFSVVSISGSSVTFYADGYGIKVTDTEVWTSYASQLATKADVDAKQTLPPGGAAGDILVKNSPTNGDAGWAAPANAVEEDNTLPITSAAVYTTVGNINALLATI